MDHTPLLLLLDHHFFKSSMGEDCKTLLWWVPGAPTSLSTAIGALLSHLPWITVPRRLGLGGIHEVKTMVPGRAWENQISFGVAEGSPDGVSPLSMVGKGSQ